MPVARLKILIPALLVAVLPLPLHAQTISDVVEHERGNYKTCGELDLGESFIWSGDLDQDQHDDIIVNTSAVTCDGQLGPECNILGCPYRIYMQTWDDGYRFVAEVRAFNYQVHYRYGIRTIDFWVAGNQCGKTNPSQCTLTTRVKESEIVVLSKQ